MTEDTAVERAQSLLGHWSATITRSKPGWLDVVVDPAALPAAAGALVDGDWGYLASISAVDLGTETQTIEVLYHFCEGAAITNLRVRVSYAHPTIPTITHLIPSALLFEQEAGEMLGVEFIGLPYTGYLFLPDEWPAGIYPLRKSFRGLDDAPIAAVGMEA